MFRCSNLSSQGSFKFLTHNEPEDDEMHLFREGMIGYLEG